MSGLAQEIQELFQLLQQDRVNAYNAISATCLLLYEVIITFPEELRFVWRSSWSFITVLHLSIRYYSLSFLILSTYVSISAKLSPEFCVSYDTYQVLGPSILVPVVDILILLRVYALYNQNKWIGAVLVFVWLVETTIIFYFIGKGLPTNRSVMANPLPGILPGCFPNVPFDGHNIVRGGAIAISCQTIYLGLALFKLGRQIKTFRLWRSMTPLLTTFFRDGALYCFNVLAMYALNVVFVQVYGAGPLQGIGELWLVSIVTITAGRLVLNLRNSVQSDEFIISGDTDNGQFTSVIFLDSERMPNAPNADPYSSFLP